MHRLITVGTAALFFGCVSTAGYAETLADRPLWEILEPGIAPVVLPQASALLKPVKSYGPSAPNYSNGAAATPTNGEFSESEQGSFGCLVGGTVGTAGALLVGGENIINLIAGGLVLPGSPAALYVSLFGVVFASFCAVGQAMTPAAMLAYRRLFEDADIPPTAGPQQGPLRETPLLGRIHKTVYEPARHGVSAR